MDKNIIIKNINNDTEEYALHRARSSYYPTTEIIYEIVKKQGLKAFQKQNKLGITPLQYLVRIHYKICIRDDGRDCEVKYFFYGVVKRFLFQTKV